MIETLGKSGGAILLAVWVVYPLAIGLAALLRSGRRTARADQSVWPKVSVVIATREQDEVVTERVSNCLVTQYPLDELELIVAWDGARDHGRRKMAAGVTEVVADAPGGKAAALNAGVSAARGDVIVFTDSHQRFRPDTIPELVEALSVPGVGAVSGRLEVPPSSLAATYWTYERWLRRMEARVHSSVGATGAIYAIRRELWQPLPSGLLLDDVYTPMRIVLAGWRVGFADSAIAVDTRRTTPRQEYARKVRTLTGVLQLCAWLPAVLVPSRNPVWLQFVFHKLLRMLTPYAIVLVILWLMAGSLSLTAPAAALLAPAVGLVLLWLGASRRPSVSQFRRLAAEGVLLQWAVVAAGINGLRGRWEVWDA